MPREAISRRKFLGGTAACVLARPMLLRFAQRTERNTSAPLAYVGCYSSPAGPEGAVGRGAGIYLFEMNPGTGALTQRDVFRTDANPSWLALDPSRTHLYSANEISSYEGKNSGSVSAWAIERASGRLTLLNTVSSEGAGPAHVSVHPSGKYALVANYHGGTVAVLPIRANGELGAATDVVHDSGTVGPAKASSRPAGSLVLNGHRKPHPHTSLADPPGPFVLARDFGLDEIFILEFDVETGELMPDDPAAGGVPPGDGARGFLVY